MANREIDAQVAEEVMGVEFVRDGDRLYYPDDGMCEYRIEFYCPHYSSRIQDAWLVVEKLKHMHPDVGLYDHGWVCTFSGDVVCSMGTATAPMAICLAALEAVRGE